MTIRWLTIEARTARRHMEDRRDAGKLSQAQYFLGYAHACEMAITKARARRKRSTRRRAR